MPTEIFISPYPPKVCYNCPERTSHCHTYCERYKAECSERERKMEKIKLDKKIDQVISDMENKKKGKF